MQLIVIKIFYDSQPVNLESKMQHFASSWSNVPGKQLLTYLGSHLQGQPMPLTPREGPRAHLSTNQLVAAGFACWDSDPSDAVIIIFFKYNQQDATLYNILFYCQCSTCFRWFLRPSSGAQKLYTQHRAYVKLACCYR